ncbi:M10 family metallopeptidase [Rhizobium sp. AAP43]|uniref:M10 family metallopeptidase n=1 Tax=Rhizobium sp. AAP43 TaxID=1523420 RepID=UPI0006B8D307|nr:M10 family metallopeptidase [Rhizobium sp. AAP43]
MALSVWTDQQVIDQLNSGSRWSGSTITYSFPTVVTAMARYSSENGFTALNATQQAQAELSLMLWDDVIASSIQKVAAGTTSTSSNIEFGNATSGVSYAHAYFPTVGSVWFNSAYNSSQGTNDLMTPKIGSHGFLTVVHEIGHALGLEHMGEYNGSADTPSSYQDSTVYSVMSYFGPSWGGGASNGEGQVAWADWVGADGRLYAPQTPMMNDIMAMQTMYGVDTTTRTGDTVYGFQSNITGATAAIYNFAQNLNPIICIWDASGIDTLNLSGWSTASTVDLAPGSFSSANSMTMNISIARGAWIENAVTGNGNDSVQGNSANNAITTNGGNDVIAALGGNDSIAAGAGNDTVDGGDGTDAVFFNDIWSNITWTYSVATATFTFMGALIGRDTIFAVERFIDSMNVERSVASLIDPSYLPAQVSVATAQAQVQEGTGTTTAVTFTVSLSKAAAAGETVSWQVAGTGTNAASSSDFSGPMSGTVTFAAGETSKLVTIYVAADSTFEGNETFKLTLSAPSSGLVLDAATAVVTVVNDDAQTTPVLLRGTARADALSGGEMMDRIEGGKGNDTLSGNAGNDILVGEAGNDVLYGGADNDTLSGGAGNDVMHGGIGVDRMDGGAGNDTYYVDNVEDVLIETRTGGTDTARTTLASLSLAAWVENLVYDGSSDFAGYGNELANTLTGGAANDLLSGGAGNDRLIGGLGNDTLIGGTGTDRLEGGAGNDLYIVDHVKDAVVEAGGAGIDTIQTSLVSYKLGNNVENLSYSGSSSFAGTGNALDNVMTGGAGNDRLDGGLGNDRLHGLGGNDTLIGGTGNDWLAGGLGNDTLTGGAGADRFFFAETGAGNADQIMDFDVNADRIVLDDLVFSEIDLGALLESAFGTGSQATTADQRILHDQASGALYYDADGNGAAAAVIFAHVRTGVLLEAEHFTVEHA